MEPEYQDMVNAIKEENLSGMEEFIRNGAPVNMQFKNREVIMHAFDYYPKARDKRIIEEIMIRLVKAGANVEQKHNKSGRTTIMMAIKRRMREETVMEFLNAGNHINNVTLTCNEGKTVLCYALQCGYSKNVITDILDKGGDVHHIIHAGVLPIYLEHSRQNRAEIIELLIRRGSDFKITKFCQDSCVFGGYCPYKASIDIVIKRGADLKQRDTETDDSLIHSSGCNYIINLCIQNGVNLENYNRYHKTPLYHAIEYLKPEKAKNLLLFGANANCTNRYGLTLLHQRTVIAREDYVNLLLFHGASLFIKTKDGMTPLDIMFTQYTVYEDPRYDLGLKTAIKHVVLYENEFMLDNEYFDNLRDQRVESYFLNFTEECREEIVKMKNTSILAKDGPSIYSFCQTRRFCGNAFIYMPLEDLKPDYEFIYDTFPIYEDLIFTRFKDNRRKNLKHMLCKLVANPNQFRAPEVDEGDEQKMGAIGDCLYLTAKNFLSLKDLYTIFEMSNRMWIVP